MTLAVTRVRAHQSMLEVADRLRQRVEALGIAVQVYLLDRQFWTYELQVAWHTIPYMMPLRRTGKKGSQGGTRPLFDLKESQFVTYTMTPAHHEPVDIDVAVMVLPESKEERQKRLAKAEAAYDKARKRVEEKTTLLNKESSARNKRALTCAKKTLAKAKARLEQERLAKPLTTLCYAINQVAHWSTGILCESLKRHRASCRIAQQALKLITPVCCHIAVGMQRKNVAVWGLQRGERVQRGNCNRSWQDISI